MMVFFNLYNVNSAQRTDTMTKNEYHDDPISRTNVLRPPRGRISTLSAPCTWYVSVLGIAIDPIVNSSVKGRAVTTTRGSVNSP
jgi:hypothetical protein